jgi:hypothetical protein
MKKHIKYIRGCKVKLLLNLKKFQEIYNNDEKITFAKISDVDLIHFDKPSLKMFVSVIYSNAESHSVRTRSKYIFNYSFNGSKPVEVEVDGLAFKISPSYEDSHYEDYDDYHKGVYNDAIRSAINEINKIKG